MLDLQKIDKGWTLFLDRDGVINEEPVIDEYILRWEDFHFAPGVLDAIKTFNGIFGTIVIATNQRCVGKGLLTIDGLHFIHDNMMKGITASGGRIDKIYFAPDRNTDAPNRKPRIGMALQAKADFPQIDFTKSIMVGNRVTDMEFGHNAGMYSVFVATTDPQTPFPHPSVDLRYNNLPEFAMALTKL